MKRETHKVQKFLTLNKVKGYYVLKFNITHSKKGYLKTLAIATEWLKLVCFLT